MFPLLLSAACSQVQWSTPGMPTSNSGGATLTVCVDVSPSYEKDIVEAVKVWDKALFTWRRLVVKNRHEGCDITIRETDTRCQNYDSNEIRYSQIAPACTDDLGGRTIFLVKPQLEGQFYKGQAYNLRSIIIHELGHVFGAQHLDGSIMAIDSMDNRCPDRITIAQVAAYNHINMRLLSYCWD